MTSSITAVPSAASKTLSSRANDAVRQQARDYEGVFLTSLMKEMFSSVKTDSSSFGGGDAEGTWRDIQAEQMANSVAQAGGIGLADAILPDLLAMQESAQNSSLMQKAQ